VVSVSGISRPFLVGQSVPPSVFRLAMRSNGGRNTRRAGSL
jgi:hypothetical protein